MKNRDLHILAKLAALRAFVERAFEGATGGWDGRRACILEYINQLEAEIRHQADAEAKLRGREITEGVSLL